jgi:hypothetical protein
MRQVKSVIPILLAICVGFVVSALPAMADFVGDTVNGTYFYPDLSSPWQNGGDQVVNPQAVFNFATNSPNTTATVSAGQIVLSFDDGDGTFNVSAFNGVVITDLTNSLITGASLDASSTLAGFNTSDISFTSNSVSLDLSGFAVHVALDRAVVVNVSFAPAAVPLHPSWPLTLLGFAGIGFMAYRRRSRPALMAT